MHYRGLLRVARRESGIRIYAVHGTWASIPTRQSARQAPRLDPPDAGHDGHASTRWWMSGAEARAAAAREPFRPREPASLRRATVAGRAEGGVRASARPTGTRTCRRHRLVVACRGAHQERHAAGMVRLLTPFDPVVWDRRRFALLWGWAYRFEASHPGGDAQARLLRAAAALAGPGYWLGQCVGCPRRVALGDWATWRRSRHQTVPSGANWRPS